MRKARVRGQHTAPHSQQPAASRRCPAPPSLYVLATHTKSIGLGFNSNSATFFQFRKFESLNYSTFEWKSNFLAREHLMFIHVRIRVEKYWYEIRTYIRTSGDCASAMYLLAVHDVETFIVIMTFRGKVLLRQNGTVERCFNGIRICVICTYVYVRVYGCGA